ncbi:MAG: chromosome segregation protein SMC [Ectothiorhodospiraceae bacterium]|nr:chromosome segregation protein SMC [Ectothiorhodospiraceae bacterium]
MYLSNIEIFGFKSFADKVNLKLNDGITAIVGPNGCGKTNIVDALRWALGEQRYSTLRSDKMEDVIFNGAKARKPINMAEVSLTIQNNRDILPIEYNELTVTRRVFRSGDSEYLLNKNVTRLKDIVSLFMDTGMGSNAYSVIELKMIESILSDKVEERRRLFEEAAGVTKYKTRRREAQRRLKDVEADLVRVNDIISEVAKAVNSLNRQAKKAERYNDYMERLRSLEINVLERDYANLFLRLEPLKERLSQAFSEKESLHHKLADDEALLRVLREEEHEAERNVAEARKNVTHYSGIIGSLDQKLLVDNERKKSLLENISRHERSIEQYGKRLTELSEEKENATQKGQELNQELDQVKERAEAKRESHQELDQQLRAKREDVQTIQTQRMEAGQEQSNLEREKESITARLGKIESRQTELHEENKTAESQLEEVRFNLNQQEEEGKDLAAAAANSELEFNSMQEKKQTLRGEIDTLQNRAFEMQSKIGERMTKIDFLNSLIDRLEGYSESIKHLMKNREWSSSQNTTVAELINTDEQYRVALEAALHDALYYIVVKDVPDAISGLQNLKDYRKGKATFIALSKIPQTQAVPFSIAGDGVLGWAYEMVNYDAQYQGLFSYLLQKTLVVRDAEVARKSIQEYPQLRCITLEGDVFNSEGLVRGGSHKKDEGSLIGKRDQIEKLNAEVVTLQAELKENQEILEERSFEHNDIDIKVYSDKMRASQHALSEFEKSLSQLRFNAEKLERTLNENNEELASLQNETEEIRQRISVIDPRLEELGTQRETLEAEETNQKNALSELEQAYGVSNGELNELNIKVAQLKGMIQNLEYEAGRISTTQDDTELARETAQRELKEAREQVTELSEEIERTEQELEVARTNHKEAEEVFNTAESVLTEKRENVEQLEQKLDEQRDRHGKSVNLVHEMELKVQEIQQQIKNLEEHGKEEFELELVRKRFEDDDVFDLAQAKDEINDLRVKVKSLGLVNPLAFEEWKKEKERLEVLNAQYDDLIEAQQTLDETIKEINETAQEKFTETFAKVRENFITIFKSLFDEGDEANLILLESDDPLEAKVEITAKPRGKRPHSIEMLSGGEKTLTAIALLFAIYLVKPSPFCILDEVDAPLDDANIERFVRILRRFSNNTQFIVVTHNKLTMEAADTLYGVTMEEEGVSKLVAVQFASELEHLIQN